MMEDYTKNDLISLIGKYFAGEFSEGEARDFLAWVELDDTRKAELEAFRKIWDNTEEFDETEARDRAWNKLNQRIEAEEPARPRFAPQRQPRSNRKIWYGVAAAVLLLATVAIGLRVLNNGGSGNDPKEIAWETIKSGDQEQKATLPDGSTIWLRRNSELQYASGFKTNRQIKLKGQAFFEVAHDKAHPFTVEAAGTMVKVLGTAFEVDAMTETATVNVSVLKGRVAFASEAGKTSKKVTLEAGERGMYKADMEKPKKLLIDDPNFLSWKSGNLKFDSSTFSYMIDCISRHYLVEVTNTREELANKRLTTSFNDASLKDAMSQLKEVAAEEFVFDYTIKDGKVVIH